MYRAWRERKVGKMERQIEKRRGENGEKAGAGRKGDREKKGSSEEKK